VVFDQEGSTSDGGAVLLGALDESLGLTRTLSACFREKRQRGKVRHSLEELVRQRVFGIACGYPDGNDVARLGRDPTQTMLCLGGRVPGEGLATQPTLSRFENSVVSKDCYRISEALAELVFARHAKRLRGKRAKVITLDLDGSADPTHGRQQLAMFSGYYDTWCYFPLFAFLSFNEEADQYLFAGILRSGRSKETEATLGLLRRVVPRLKELFPYARIRVRLDAGFQGPELLALLEDLQVDYVVGLAENPVLQRLSSKLQKEVERESDQTGRTVTQFGEGVYAARSWNEKLRRVIFKAEHLQSSCHVPKNNPRYVVTNLKGRPATVYSVYCERGDVENRIKELKYGLHVDRTSCHRAVSNQLRILFTAAAYVLYQEMRLRIARTAMGRAQVDQLRLMFIKIGGFVKRSVRRIVFHLTRHHPWIDLWLATARTCGGFSTVLQT
jgi:hypothetical protein